MTDHDPGSGGSGELRPPGSPATSGAGQPAELPSPADVLAPKGPTVANSLLNAILEGSSTVVTILAIFVAIVIGGLLIAFTSPPVLHAWSHVFSAPGAAFYRPGMWPRPPTRPCSRAPS